MFDLRSGCGSWKSIKIKSMNNQCNLKDSPLPPHHHQNTYSIEEKWNVQLWHSFNNLIKYPLQNFDYFSVETTFVFTEFNHFKNINLLAIMIVFTNREAHIYCFKDYFQSEQHSLQFWLPGVVPPEADPRLSPFSSSNWFLGCSTWSPPAKNSDLSHSWYSSSSAERRVPLAWYAAWRPSSTPRVRCVSIRGEEAVLVSEVWTMSFWGWKVKGHWFQLRKSYINL